MSDQWELYYLANDPEELINLCAWDAEGQPVLCPSRMPEDWGLSVEKLEQALLQMRKQLIALEEQYLGGPKPVTQPYTLEAQE